MLETLEYHYKNQLSLHIAYEIFGIELPLAFLSEMLELINESVNYFYVSVQIDYTGESFAVVIAFYINGVRQEEITTEYILTIDLSRLSLYARNHYRITAIYNNRNIGGTYDPATSLFTIRKHTSGSFVIAYVEDLVRLLLRPDSYEIIDLAGNKPTITMDVLPLIQNDRTFLPIRFIAYVFDSGVGWDCESSEVTLTHNGEILTFAIGQVVDGMDIPARIINDRTFVPLRFIGEFFETHVSWDENTRSIEIVR